MTARKPLPVGAIPVEVYGRKAYGARLSKNADLFGYEFTREWCDRRYSLNGRKGQWVILDRPGWFEVVTYTHGTFLKVRQFFGFDGQTLEEVSEDNISVAVGGPAPGSAGAWFGSRCSCGGMVETFDAVGWPRCADHTEKAEVA